MKVIIFASGYTKPEYFGNYLIPKCLMTLKDDYTILDYQMNVLQKYGFPITIVIGYRGEEIINYCAMNNYDVEFVWDDTYQEEYSLIRMINKVGKPTFQGSAIMIFSDTLFKDEMIEYFLNDDNDISKAYNMYKVTTKGMDAMVNILNINHHLEGLNSQMFFKIEERYPDLKLRRVYPPIWQYDVDRSEELVQARTMFK